MVCVFVMVEVTATKCPKLDRGAREGETENIQTQGETYTVTCCTGESLCYFRTKEESRRCDRAL